MAPPRYSKPKADLKPSDIGWGHRTVTNSIQLPATLKCNRCQKLRAKERFSTRQLQIIVDNVKHSGISGAIQGGTGYAGCNMCMGSSVHELECVVCGATKSKDEFSKTQRRNPDAAECFECVDKRLKVEPNNHNDDSDDDYEDDSSGGRSNPYDEDDDDNDLVTESQTDGGVALPSYYPGSSEHGSTPDGWYTVPRAGSRFTSSVMTTSRGATGSVLGHSGSVVSSSTSARPVKVTKSGWAKPPRGHSESYEDHIDENTESKHKHGDDDDDDDDDDFEL